MTKLGYKFILALMLAFAPPVGFAVSAADAAPALGTQQQLPVKGVVKDTDGNPLVGVTVIIKGTTQGTSTQMDGSYSINCAPGAE